MQLLKRILDNVGRTWNTLPTEIPTLMVERGGGKHTNMTIEPNKIYFHSVPFRSDIPTVDSIVLEGMSLEEIVAAINSMGYIAGLTEEAHAANLRTMQGYNLIPGKNIYISGDRVTIPAFTSSTWKLLYPIYRLLKVVDGDIDDAVRQMTLSTASGMWVDYWASFFEVQRKTGESDRAVIKRVFIKLFTPKVNNVAMQEIINFHLDNYVTVQDVSPTLFKTVADPDYMNDSAKVREIVLEVKGAGLDFFLEYMRSYPEDYPHAFSVMNKRTFKNSDEASKSSISELWEDQYWTKRRSRPPIYLNTTTLNDGGSDITGAPDLMPDEERNSYGVIFTQANVEKPYERLHTSYYKPLWLNLDTTNSLTNGLFDIETGYLQLVLGEFNFPEAAFKTPSEAKSNEVALAEDYFKEEETFTTRKHAIDGPVYVRKTFNPRVKSEVSSAIGHSDEKLPLRVVSRTTSGLMLNTGSLNSSRYYLWGEEESDDRHSSIGVQLADKVALIASEGLLASITASEERSYRDKKQGAIPKLNTMRLNTADEITSYEEKILDRNPSIQVTTSDRFTVNYYQRPQGFQFLQTSTGILNNSRFALYSVENYGDIMNTVNIGLAETFPSVREVRAILAALSSEDDYSRPVSPLSFGLNRSRLNYVSPNNTERLSVRDFRIQELCSMTLTTVTSIIKQQSI